MAIREELTFDLDRAQQQIDDLEAQLDSLLTPREIPISVSTGAVADLATMDARLDGIEAGASAVTSEIARLEAALGRADADFANVARAIGISEDEAEQLTAEFVQARVASRELEDNVRDLARQLGLSEAEARDLQQALTGASARVADVGRASRSVDVLGRSMRRLAAIAATAFSAQQLTQFASASISAASDLAESTSKAEVVFGEFSDTVFEFTDNAPQALGLSTRAALEATGTFGNLFTALGLSREAAADLSPDIVQLGADLASFNNLEVGDALEKLRSGLVGEIEPLRALGVSFNAAQVEAKAFELGLADVNGQISDAGKVQARYALILEQTTNAQGDFARTADGVANRQRQVNAQFDNFQAAVGQTLLPLYEELLRVAPDVLAAFEDLVPVISDAAAAVGGFFASLQDAEGVNLAETLAAVSAAFGTIGDQAGNVRDNIAAVTGLLTGDFARIGDSVDTISERLGRLGERTALIQLTRDLSRGGDAAEALARSLQIVARTPGATALVGAYERLASAADLTNSELFEVTSNLIGQADAYGLTAAEVEFLRGRLVGLNVELSAVVNAARRGPRSGGPRRGLVVDPADAQTEAAALATLRDAADTLGVSLTDLAAAGDVTDDVAAALERVPPATLEWEDAKDRIADFATEAVRSLADAVDIFEQVPDTIRSFGKDTSKALSIEEFLKNLQVTAGQQAEFEANLARLFRVAPQLARALQQEGVAARDLVADFLDDATSARRAEALLTGNARDITGTFVEGLRTSIIGSGLDLVGADALAEFLAGMSDPELIRVGLEAIAAEFERQARGINVLLDFGFTGRVNPTISGTSGDVGHRLGETRVAGTGGVTINNTINNPTSTDLSTNVTQLSQTMGAVGASLLRRTTE